MARSPRISPRTGLVLSSVLACAGVGGLSGCASPSRANVELRRQNAALESQIDQLKKENAALAAQINGIRATTVPTLPLERLNDLFTAHGVEINRLTTGSDLKHEGRGDTGIRLYIFPKDDRGNPIQATGQFSVDAFDLSQRENPLIGHWEFGPQDCKNSWFGGFLRYSYIFELPWQRPPAQKEVTVRAQFTDALTNRIFTAEYVVKVSPAPATAPVSSGTAPTSRR
jgi:outer membrane murein-binding lipoprotein Lpp